MTDNRTLCQEQHKENSFSYTPLPEPLLITEHIWPEGTRPLVNTLTLTYQQDKYIRDCIEGILMQKTTFPVQVLIHDDASEDKTAEIVKEYHQRFPNLIRAYYQRENTYRNVKRRELRKEFFDWIEGKYIALCEGDDYWTDPLKLEKQVAFLENNPEYSMCYHDWVGLNDGRFQTPVNNFCSTHTRVFRNIDIEFPQLKKPITNGDSLYKFLLRRKGKIKKIHDIIPAVKREDSKGVWSSLSEEQKVHERIKTYKIIIDSLKKDNRFDVNDLLYWRFKLVREMIKSYLKSYLSLSDIYSLYRSHIKNISIIKVIMIRMTMK